jgi:hypothetical protein
MLKAENITYNLIGSSANQYMSYARNVAVNLIPLAKGMGGYMSRSIMFDGATIIIRFADPFIKIYIEKEPAGENMVHGMVSGGTFIPKDPEDKKSVNKLDSFYPSSFQSSIDGKPREFRLESKLATKPDDSIADGLDASLCQAGAIAPTMYTGRMRKVVQLLMGLPGKKLKYDFRFTRTHGVYVDSNGEDWLIEVSQANGVLAMPMPKKKVPPMSTDANQLHILSHFPYIPTGETFPSGEKLDDAIDSGKVFRLLSSEDLGDFYEKNAFYESSGWSFSESGHSILNTCFAEHEEYDVNFSYLYKISILDSLNSGIAELSSSISIDASGPLLNKSESKMFVCDDAYSTRLVHFPIASSSVDEGEFGMFSSPVFSCHHGNEEVVISISKHENNELSNVVFDADYLHTAVRSPSYTSISFPDAVNNNDIIGKITLSGDLPSVDQYGGTRSVEEIQYGFVGKNIYESSTFSSIYYTYNGSITSSYVRGKVLESISIVNDGFYAASSYVSGSYSGPISIDHTYSYTDYRGITLDQDVSLLFFSNFRSFSCKFSSFYGFECGVSSSFSVSPRDRSSYFCITNIGIQNKKKLIFDPYSGWTMAGYIKPDTYCVDGDFLVTSKNGIAHGYVFDKYEVKDPDESFNCPYGWFYYDKKCYKQLKKPYSMPATIGNIARWIYVDENEWTKLDGDDRVSLPYSTAYTGSYSLCPSEGNVIRRIQFTDSRGVVSFLDTNVDISSKSEIFFCSGYSEFIGSSFFFNDIMLTNDWPQSLVYFNNDGEQMSGVDRIVWVGVS